jgi:hypothetical protein
VVGRRNLARPVAEIGRAAGILDLLVPPAQWFDIRARVFGRVVGRSPRPDVEVLRVEGRRRSSQEVNGRAERHAQEPLTPALLFAGKDRKPDRVGIAEEDVTALHDATVQARLSLCRAETRPAC